MTNQLLANQIATHTLLPAVLAAHEETNRKVDLLLSAHAASQGTRMLAFPPPSGFDAYAGHWNLQLCSIRRTYLGECISECRCSCHYRSTLRSPSYLRSFLGMLFLGYVGVPSISPDCDDVRCKHKSDTIMRVTYCFPHWFIARAINLTMKMSRPDGFTQNLRISRVIPDSSRIFMMAEEGDVEGMKQIFSLRRASPFDLGSSGGRTPLLVNPDLFQLLLCHGLTDFGATMRTSEPEAGCLQIFDRHGL